MGLSRKLGGGAAAFSSRPETPVCVDYKWSTQAYALRDILTRFQLPCVVQCAADPGSVVWADFQFDLRQPLLLHAARTVRKIHARSLKVEGQTDQLQEFGPPLAIPEDYDGWFYPVTKKDPTALPRHTRVEGAAASPARQFLVTTTLPAFVPSFVPATGPKYSSHEVMVGEVLTKVDVVTDNLSLEVATPSTDPGAASCFPQESALLGRKPTRGDHPLPLPRPAARRGGKLRTCC
ncbi:uncharacterized protein LOC112573082 [Pomacea canaliculata]|uniref:uncharacterized protein LOC112573082 n=1 Tax=Pomacea canaliculata TaxID=400727 RepID=UPI000D734105|nr:uncharacterized protein LOC112573082 [Pomacea canaliculata]